MEKITQLQIDEWKKKYEVVVEYTVDEKTGYFRKPTRQEVSYATVASNRMADSVKYAEILLNSCWLGGDRDIIDKDEYFYGAVGVIETLADTKVGDIKKL